MGGVMSTWINRTIVGSARMLSTLFTKIVAVPGEVAVAADA